MSNEKQDLINHRLTATACKNYTDKEIKKAKDRIISFLSRNTVDTIDHTNELTYQITAPSGAKLLQLQAIGGNSVKYEPSVASDDTTALIKTMPSVVYDFDVNKVKGVSEVSENLIVLQDVAETTDNGITYSISNGVLTMNGTATSNFNFGISLSKTIPVDTYSSLINISGTTTATGNWVLSYSRYEGNLFNLGKTDGNTVTSTTTQEASALRFYVGSGTVFTNYKIKVMLVKGSTAPTEFKVGYEGIHNNELTGFKVEGANLWDIGRLNITKNYGASGTIGTLEAGTYTISWASIGNISAYLNIKVGTTVIKNINMNKTITTGKIDGNSFNFTLSETSVVSYLVDDYYSITTTTYAENVMLNRGSTALAYVPYVQPTAIPIDLTSIVDSSGNKLFEDGSLKGINDVYDEITPYKAIKNVIQNTNTTNFHYVDNYTLNDVEYSHFRINIAKEILPKKGTKILSNFKFSSTGGNFGRRSGTWIGSASSTDVNWAFQLSMPTSLVGNTSETIRNYFTTNPLILVYELATPIEADIDLSQLKSIQGHSNGSITALNTYDMPVPSEIRYNSIIQDTLCPSVTVEGANLLGNHNLELFVSNRYIKTSQNVLIIPNRTYTFSNSISNGVDGSISILDESLNVIQTIAQSTTNKRLVTFTTLPNAKYFKIDRWYIENTTFTIESAEVMLNEGSIVLPYRPYKAPITRNLPTITSDGYGVNANAHNLRVFSDYEGNAVNKRYTNVNKGDMGDYTYSYNENLQWFSFTPPNHKYMNNATLQDCLVNSYTPTTYNSLRNDTPLKDMYIAIAELCALRDLRYDNATIFKTAMANEPLYYELNDNSKTETDIDSFDYFFNVEEGDVITFNNPYAQQVYATYSFITKEVKSNE